MPGTQRAGRSRRHNIAPYERQPTPRSPSPTPQMSAQLNAHVLDSDRSPLPTDARQLTRMVAMFWSARAVLNAGTELRRALDNGSDDVVWATATKAQKLNFALYDELDRLQPDLFDFIATNGAHYSRSVRDKLNEGRSGAKAEDNNKVKHAIVHFRQWAPPLIDESKSSRGLAHLECARLLSPIIVNWEDAEARRQFIECGNPPMIASHWPRLIYPDGIGNPSRPSEGLLQSQLLVDAAKVILQSPSSVLPAARARPGAVRRGRKGIATKYQLTEITPAFLAYVAVIVRFALSAEESFNDDGGTFNYIKFYTELREYLESPRFSERVGPLIAWWNKTLFPNALHHNNGTAGSEVQGGMLSLLAAEIEADEEHNHSDED